MPCGGRHTHGGAKLPLFGTSLSRCPGLLVSRRSPSAARASDRFCPVRAPPPARDGRRPGRYGRAAERHGSLLPELRVQLGHRIPALVTAMSEDGRRCRLSARKADGSGRFLRHRSILRRAPGRFQEAAFHFPDRRGLRRADKRFATDAEAWLSVGGRHRRVATASRRPCFGRLISALVVGLAAVRNWHPGLPDSKSSFHLRPCSRAT